MFDIAQQSTQLPKNLKGIVYLYVLPNLCAMTKNDRLIKLFIEEFGEPIEPLSEGKVECYFKCKCQFKATRPCDIDRNSLKYTGILGHTDTDIMVIAEAPSATNGNGAYFGGQLETMLHKLKGANQLKLLIEFAKEDGKYPYFTDINKCGVPDQSRKNGLNKIRRDNCIDTFLKQEILIIEPRLIYCIGQTAYKAIIDLKNNTSLNNENPELSKILGAAHIVELLHYSQQAGIPLSAQDKETIWKIQAGRTTRKEFASLIENLTFFRDILKNVKE